MQTEAQNMEEILALGRAMYPGKGISDLTEQETNALFDNYEAQRGIGEAMMAAPTPQGQTVGPSGLYVDNPWNHVATAIERVAGGYMMGQANKKEKVARKTAADLQTRRDAQDREFRTSREDEEARRQREWLQQILSRGNK